MFCYLFQKPRIKTFRQPYNICQRSSTVLSHAIIHAHRLVSNMSLKAFGHWAEKTQVLHSTIVLSTSCQNNPVPNLVVDSLYSWTQLILTCGQTRTALPQIAGYVELGYFEFPFTTNSKQFSLDLSFSNLLPLYQFIFCFPES